MWFKLAFWDIVLDEKVLRMRHGLELEVVSRRVLRSGVQKERKRGL